MGRELQHLGGVVPQRGNFAGHQSPDDEDAAEDETDHGAADDGALISAEEPHVSEMQRA